MNDNKDNNKRNLIIKFVFSVVIAFILLNIVFLFYRTLPVHIPNESGATDYKWEKEALFIKATEGFSVGFTDNNGYLNSYSPVNNSIGTLIMGSSHMEAINVMPNKNATYLLNGLLNKNDYDHYVYSIGISEHPFLRCTRNIENALIEFSPEKFVVIETANINFNEDSINQVLNNTYPKVSSYNQGIIGKLQKLPFLRMIYYQIVHGLLENDSIEETTLSNSDESVDFDSYQKKLNALLLHVSEVADKYGCKVVIVYHPRILLNENDECYVITEKNYLSMFSNLCDDNNIIFRNMKESFIANYKNEYKLPHGFTNTSVGKGHLNNTGHRLIAEELYSIIAADQETEE